MRLLWRSRAALIALGAALGPDGPAAARDAFGLSWQAPAECPSHEQVAAALRRLAAAGSHLEDASVHIVRSAERWQATLFSRGAQRRLEGESCAAVVEALTVVLALAAEQAEQAAAEVPAQSAPPLAVAPPAPSDVPPRAEPAPSHDPAAISPEQRPLRWALRVGLWAELGLLPGPSLGPRAALELHRGPWSVELGVAGLLPRHATLAGAGSPSSDLRWLGGQLALCRGRRVGFSLCLGAEPGRLSGTGSGVDQPIDADGWWLAATAGARWLVPLNEPATLSWQAGLGAAAALLRPEFGFDELGVLHRPSPVSGRLFLGLGWR